jgi:hypothetical protein
LLKVIIRIYVLHLHIEEVWELDEMTKFVYSQRQFLLVAAAILVKRTPNRLKFKVVPNLIRAETKLASSLLKKKLTTVLSERRFVKWLIRQLLNKS